MVADFDDSGLETVVLASFDAGGDTTLYSASDSRWGASGSLVGGDVNLDDDTPIIRVMLPNNDGSLLRFNDDGADGGLVLRDFFGASGAGADLTVWVQTGAGTASFAANDIDKVGKDYVNFKVPSSDRSILTGIGTGDRFLVALTRPAPNTPAAGDPTITGTAQVGQTLTAGTSGITDADGLDNVAYTYRWLADDTEITDATASAYTLVDDDEGKKIKARVSFSDDGGNAEERTSSETAAVAAAPNTPAAGDPTITGTAQVGQTLTAATSGITDADGLDNVAYTYRWLADDAEITNATASTYTLTTAEEGKAIKVRVSFDDDEGNAEERTSAATVAVAAAQTDNTAPTISSVAITSDTGYYGVYGIGDNVEVTVTFSEDVTVTGSPQLELTIGSPAKNAAYKSVTGSEVVFSYTVASGDNDTDGIAIGANKLILNGGGIEDNAGNSADLSHSALSTQPSHEVDGIRPTITNLTLIGSTGGRDGIYISGERLIAEVLFSEEVIHTDPPLSNPLGPRQNTRLKLSVGGSSRYATSYGQYSECDEEEQVETSWGTICSPTLGSSGDNLRFKYEVARGDLDSDGVSIDANAVDLNGGTVRDFAGNDAVLTNSATGPHSNFLVDAVPAAVQSVAITSEPESDKTYGCRETIEVTVTFSESVRVPNWYGANGLQMPQLELNIGGVKRLAKTHERSTIIGTSVVFYYTVEIDDQDADGISIGANALKLNGGSIEDNSGDGPTAGEDANISHSAVAATANHKVSTSGCSDESADESAGDPSDATLSALSLIGYEQPHKGLRAPVNIDTFDIGHDVVHRKFRRLRHQ